MNEADKKKPTEGEEPAQEVRKPRAVIIDDSGYRPELDPKAPEFDPAQYAEAINAAGGMKKMTEELAQSFRDIGKIIGAPLELDPSQFLSEFSQAAAHSLQGTRDTIKEDVEHALKASLGLIDAVTTPIEQTNIPAIFDALNSTLSDNISDSISLISAFVRSPLYRQINEGLERLKELVEGHRDALETVYSLPEDLQELYPFLIEVFEAMRTAGELPGDDFSLTDLLKTGFDEAGNPTAPIFETALNRARQRKAEQEKAETALIDIQTIIDRINRPTAHTMLNNPAINKMQSAETINAGAFDLTVSNPKGKRKEITAYTMISYDSDEDSNVSITNLKLSEYERQVSDAIVSLYLEAKKNGQDCIITPDMIYKAMPGGGEKASKKQEEAIINAVERFRRILIKIDATEEMRKRGIIPETGTYRLNDYFLSAVQIEVTFKKGGKKATGYRINAEPIMYSYSKATKQLLTVSPKVLDIRKVKDGKAQVQVLSMDQDRQAMAGYMMRRIGLMKRDAQRKKPILKDTILFDTLFKETGQDTANKVETKRNREFCFEVLDYWKATGHIADYEKQTKGRSITGVKIIL